jgi:undecaprenyl-phosphate 4-deoxy-4-formamido-L-arabinose transferase
MISIFSGAQLFALGIFGEYLARMHFRSMDRPPYLIGEMAALPESDSTVMESVSRPFQENGIV